jgi:hypothetical protein
MIPFKKYLGESHSPDWIDSDATVVSFTSLEKLLFERNNLEYSIFVPRNLNARRENEKIRSYFQEQRTSLYPVAVGHKRGHGRIYVAIKKPHTRSNDFREMVSDAFYGLQNFDAIYTSGTSIKTLTCDGVKVFNEEASISKFQEIVSEFYGKRTTFYGLEVAINEEIKYHFQKNNLVSYPLTEYDFKYSKNWNNFLND